MKKPNERATKLHIWSANIAAVDAVTTGQNAPGRRLRSIDDCQLAENTAPFHHAVTDHFAGLLAKRQVEAEPLRCWVPNCRQGETAYELSVMLAEAFGDDSYQRRFKIFATDVDPDQLAKARSGRFPAHLAQDVPDAAFVDREHDLLMIRHELRELMIFAEHDLLCDPPITKLDLIRYSHRLDQFKDEERKRLIQIFHYALNPGGYLFLNQPDTAFGVGEYFDIVDERLPVFRRVASKKSFAQDLFPVNYLRNRVTARRARKCTYQHQLECDVEELRTLNDELRESADEAVVANEELKVLNQELLARSDLMIGVIERLETSKARYRSVVEDQSEYICRYRSDGTITFANGALCRALAHCPDQIVGRNFGDLWPCSETLSSRLAGLSPLQPKQCIDLKVETADGHASWQHWSDRAFFNSDGRIVEYQSVGKDITSRIEAEQKYRYLAVHDQLTGLANRHGFFEFVKGALAAASRESQRTAVHYLDLDQFKDINDGLGHAVGDALLRSVGKRLSQEVRSNDFVARLGGDEFAVVQTFVRDIDDVVNLAKRLLEAVQNPFDITENCLKISATIGIVLFPDDGGDADLLLDRADLAMYEGKKLGGSRFGFFTRGFNKKVAERFQLKSELSVAIDQKQFRIHYQPIVDLNENRICALEALLRWHHPTRGLLEASAFIDTLETIPEVRSVGLWALETACHQAREWLDGTVEGVRLNVNLSGCMLKDPALVDNVHTVLDRTGFDPARLELEVTEHAVITIGLSEAADRLRQLNDLGIGIALDDFGTGYSSLTFLRTLPVSHIKIDRSFVAGLKRSSEDQAIVKAVIDLGRSLSLSVTAEGVEEKEVASCLKNSGCDQAQGYLYGAAVPAPAMAGMLRKGAKGQQSSV